MTVPSILFSVCFTIYLVVQFLRDRQQDQQIDILQDSVERLMNCVKALDRDINEIIMEMSPPSNDGCDGWD